VYQTFITSIILQPAAAAAAAIKWQKSSLVTINIEQFISFY
jgi:hypothetical protein